MVHDEAVEILAVEQYLLEALDPNLRDEFEDHLFDCTECVLDLRAGATFLAVYGSRRWGGRRGS